MLGLDCDWLHPCECSGLLISRVSLTITFQHPTEIFLLHPFTSSLRQEKNCVSWVKVTRNTNVAGQKVRGKSAKIAKWWTAKCGDEIRWNGTRWNSLTSDPRTVSLLWKGRRRFLAKENINPCGSGAAIPGKQMNSFSGKCFPFLQRLHKYEK